MMSPGRALPVVTVALTTLTVGACGPDAPQPDAAGFCAEIAANRDAVVDPALDTELDLAGVVEVHRRLAALAPLAIAEEWQVLLDVVERADAIARDDTAAVAAVVEAAYAAERSAVRVAEWVLASCGVDLGPVTTISPQGRPEPADPPGVDPD
jgi:hypothetical protein